jgi:hypothetical protein
MSYSIRCGSVGAQRTRAKSLKSHSQKSNLFAVMGEAVASAAKSIRKQNEANGVDMGEFATIKKMVGPCCIHCACPCVRVCKVDEGG